jgi:hypothetical protein
MPTKRKPLHRSWRPGRFSLEVLTLFLEIERTPGGNRPYTDASRRLARMLGLTNEWWVSCHVNDRSSRSGYPLGHLTDIAFWKVREVRKALLAVCVQRAGEAEAAQTQATERAQELEAAAVSPAELTEAPAEPPPAA